MEWLKELLKDVVAEDKLDGVVESFNKEFPKHAVPKKVFNETKEALDTTKQTLEDTNVTIKSLQNKPDTVEGYETKIKELKQSIEGIESKHKSEIDSIKKRTAYKDMLIDANFNKQAVDLLVKTADFESISLDDSGNISNKDTLVSSLTESHGDLINKVTQQSSVPGEQHQNNQNKNIKDMDTKEYFESIGMKPFNRR